MKNSRLQYELSKLNDTIQNLKEIVMEQIRVMMDIINKTDVLFEKIFFPTINL